MFSLVVACIMNKMNLERIIVELTCCNSYIPGAPCISSQEARPLAIMEKCLPFFTQPSVKRMWILFPPAPFCDPLHCSVWQVNMLLTTILDSRYVIKHQSLYWASVYTVFRQTKRRGLLVKKIYFCGCTIIFAKSASKTRCLCMYVRMFLPHLVWTLNTLALLFLCVSFCMFCFSEVKKCQVWHALI